jgi:ABC-type glycerol-3-phosphate transport system substrate-binding protein
VPITDSSVIEEHSEFFDSIADYTTDKNGEIWCEPIYADTFAAFYIPENLKAVGADVKDIETFDGFFDVLEKINAQEKYKFYSGSTLDFAYSMEESYNVNYSYLDYNSDTFRNMFERIYSGWIAWSNPLEGKSENPLFYNTASDSEVSDWNSSDAALQLDYVSEFFVSAENPGDWNAAGLPSVSSSEEKTPVTVYYAVINPSGNNKNAAEAYLGYIAENRFNLRTKQTFLYKDRNLYADNFDTTAAYFDELYKLYENSSVYERLLPMNEDFGQDVIQYQLGEITLDDYIAKLERTSEMTANE